MNLRILKKLSKRAAPYLDKIGDGRKRFIAVRGENCHGLNILDRWGIAAPPLKGTQMVGSSEGYYEPEWEEQTAWEALSNWVWGQHWNYDPATDAVSYSKAFHHPGEIFREADALLSQSPQQNAGGA